MPISPDDLLKPRKRVFTRPKRQWGPISVLLSVAAALALTVVYGSWFGALWAQGWVMLGVGLLGAVVAPLVLVRKLRGRGPRLFALVDVVVAVVAFTLLGGFTDRTLAEHGAEPFRSVGRLLGGPDGAQSGGELGQGLVGLLRRLTVSPAPEEARQPEPAPAADAPPADAGPAAPPSAGVAAPAPAKAPGGEDAQPAEAAGKDTDAPADTPAVLAARHTGPAPAPSGTVALQNAVRDRAVSAGGGTYNVLGSGRAADDTISIPISGSHGTFTVGALVDGRVPAEFTFDTGADQTAITPTLARRLGIDADALTERRRLLTPGGPIEAPVAPLSSISIDGAEVRDLEVVVCAQCPSNLLGRDFQRHFRVEIDGRGGVLRLHRR